MRKKKKIKMDFEFDWKKVSDEFKATYFQLLFYFLRDVENAEEEEAFDTAIAFFEEEGLKNIREEVEKWSRSGLLNIKFHEKELKYIG